MIRLVLLLLALWSIPTGAWAAVARSDAVVSIQSSLNSSSQAVTVPADAVLAIASVAGFHSTDNYFSAGSLTLGGAAMTVGRADDEGSVNEQSAVFYLTNPATGSQTLAWDWAGTINAVIGVQFYVAFYTGVNTAAPIRSAGGQALASSDVATTGSLSASAGDLVAAIGHGANSSTPPTAIAWTNATETNELLFNSGRTAYAEATPSGAVTITVTQSGGTGATHFTNVSAVVLAASSASSVGSLSLGGGLRISPGTLTLGEGLHVAP